MGKAGRVACIFTPMLLTIASLICLLCVEIAGWTPNGSLSGLYFFQADLTNLTVANAGSAAESSTLTAALSAAKASDVLAEIYQIHLWNYCASGGSNTTIVRCSARESEFYFDPVDAWQLNITSASEAATVKDGTAAIEQAVLGDAGADAIKAYRTASKWMFIAYEISFWTTVATLVFGIFAVCSRWGSFLTWICSFISSVVTLGAVLTSTILFSIVVTALNKVLQPYDVHLSLGTSSLTVTWLAVLFSWAATLFWLFSVCCCSGRSNPHHRSNSGGLWNAEYKDSARGTYNFADRDTGYNRNGLRVEKTGAAAIPTAGSRGYYPVPAHLGAHDDHDADHLPLQDYAVPTAGYAAGGYTGQSNGRVQSAYEPYRHQ